MGDEQAAIEKTDVSDQGAGDVATGFLRFGEALKEQGLQEFGEEAVLTAAPALRELGREIVEVAVVQEVFALQKPALLRCHQHIVR